MPLQPKDYLLNLPDPADQARKQLELATGVMQVRRTDQLLAAQQQENDLKAQAQQQKMAAAQAFESDFQATYANPNPEAIRQFRSRYPNVTEDQRRGFDAMDEAMQKAWVSQNADLYVPLLNGAPEIAIRKGEELAEAFKNAGQPEKAAGVLRTVDKIKSDPLAAEFELGARLQEVDKDGKMFDAFQKMSLASEKRRQEIAARKSAESGAVKFGVEANVAQKYGEDQAKASLEASRASAASSRDAIASRKAEAAAKVGKPPDDVRKDINADEDAAIAAATGAKRAGSLAKLARNQLKTYGIDARVNETLKSLFGTEDKETAARKEITDFINSDVLKNLPAGAASDRDIEIVRSGLPDVNGNPERVAEFLEAKERVMQGIVRVSQAKSAWRRANAGDLGATARPITIAGVEVKPGTSFSQFIAETAPKAADPTAGRPSGGPAAAAASPPRQDLAKADTAQLEARRAALLRGRR